jgi:hypothetical protein
MLETQSTYVVLEGEAGRSNTTRFCSMGMLL